jgi:hypothetical protein
MVRVYMDVSMSMGLFSINPMVREPLGSQKMRASKKGR